ncbi:hypothetical protein ACWDSJ_26105 [Nocardia sp. NPDC003482]
MKRATTPHVAALAVSLLGLAALVGCTSHTDTTPAVSNADVHAAPTNLRSDRFQGIVVPLADQGPHRQTDAAATGFDHSPVGAALAAIQATVRMSVATDNQWPTVGQQMLAPGPGRDAWAVARAQLSITEPPSGPVVTILGYQVTSYTPDRAATAIYSLQPDSSLTCNTATVVWMAEDWKLLLPDQPQVPVVANPTSLPAGLVTLPMR